ncbi:MAG TPA: hypothetical protein VIJ46_00945, partial [Rhabdochlamydiaceae bacterium]
MVSQCSANSDASRNLVERGHSSHPITQAAAGSLEPLPGRSNLTAEQSEQFKRRIEKERKHQEQCASWRKGSGPTPQLGETLSYAVKGKSDPFEQAYVAVDRLLRKGHLSNLEGETTLNIENESHWHAFAFALKIVDPKNTFKDLTYDDQLLGLRILCASKEANSLVQEVKSDFSRGLDKMTAGLDDFGGFGGIGNSEDAENIHTALSSFVPGYDNASSKIEGVRAVMELSGIRLKTIPIDEAQFNRVCGDSFPTERIRDILDEGSGVNLSYELHLKLLTKYCTHKESDIPAQAANSAQGELTPKLDAKAKEEQRTRAGHFLAVAEERGVTVPDAALKEELERFKQGLLSDQEARESAQEIERLENERIARAESRFRSSVHHIAQELGVALHAYGQRGERIEHHLRTFNQTERDFLAALKIDDFSQFQNKSIGSVQKLIKDKLVQAAKRAGGFDKSMIGVAFEEDVTATRKGIARCAEMGRSLETTHHALREAGALVAAFERRSQMRALERAEKLQDIALMGHVVKMACGITASCAPGGQIAGAAMLAGEAVQLGIGQADSLQNAAWDSKLGRYQNQVARFASASGSLSNHKAHLQTYTMELEERRRQSNEFLLNNPHMFREQAYLSFLRDAIEEERADEQRLSSQIERGQAESAQLARMMAEDYAPLLAKLDAALSQTHGYGKRKPLIAQRSKHETDRTKLSAKQGDIELETDKTVRQKKGQTEFVAALEAQYSRYKKFAELPDHLKEGASAMTPEDVLVSSNSWTAKLESELDSASKAIQALQLEMDVSGVDAGKKKSLEEQLRAAIETKDECQQRL